jgi:bifunctional non-homologous end joining protein LigD
VWAPPALRRVKIQEKAKIGDYLIADTVEALVSLAQMDILEIHTWNTRFDRVEQPDRLVIDLDRGEQITWPDVVAAAVEVRTLLDTLELASFVKTTGGRGLHVVVPLARRQEWRACLEFARAFADALARHDPARYTTDFGKKGRARQILVDYLRNNRTNTSIAAFSTRARAGAPVSVPLAWSELTPSLDPASFTPESVPERFARRPDPWAGYWKTRQSLSSRALKALQQLDF